jgi:hypothetical protein
MKRYAIAIAGAAALALGLQSCGDILGSAYAGLPLETDGAYWRVVREVGATGTGDEKLRAAPALMDADSSGRLYLLDLDPDNEYARLKVFGANGALERALGEYSSVTNEISGGADIQWSGSETGLAASIDGSQIFASSSNAPYLFHYAIASGTWDHRDTGDANHVKTLLNPRTVRIASDGSVYLLNYDPAAYACFIARFAYGSGANSAPDARYDFASNQDIVDFDIGPDGRIFALYESGNCFYALGADLASISDPFGSDILSQPTKIAVDAEGYVHVVEGSGNKMATFSSAGGLVRRWGLARGTALGRFDAPAGYAGALIPGAASSGRILYLSDYGDARVQAFERVTQSPGTASSVRGSAAPGRYAAWPVTVKVRDDRGRPITGLGPEAFSLSPSIGEAAWLDDVNEVVDGSGAQSGDYTLACMTASSDPFDLGVGVMGAEVGRIAGVAPVAADAVYPLTLTWVDGYTAELYFAGGSGSIARVDDLSTSTQLIEGDDYLVSVDGSMGTIRFYSNGYGEETHVMRVTFGSGSFFDVTVEFHVT